MRRQGWRWRLALWFLSIGLLFIQATGIAQVGAGARPPSGRAGQSPPAPTDLMTVLFNAHNALGMLRGARQQDAIATFEFWATGTMSVAGQPATVTSYRGSINYQF